MVVKISDSETLYESAKPQHYVRFLEVCEGERARVCVMCERACECECMWQIICML
jgi:hypothetical protein